jgi:hypothetical protein
MGAFADAMITFRSTHITVLEIHSVMCVPRLSVMANEEFIKLSELLADIALTDEQDVR